MIGTDSNHCRIVAESLAGDREVDERTYISLAVLAERLGQLKECDDAFSSIEFSSAVKKLQSQRSTVVVG